MKANGGWLKIYDFKKFFALAYSMPSSVTFIVTELSEQGIERVGILGSGIWTKYSASLGERKISWRDKGFDRYLASIRQICT